MMIWAGENPKLVSVSHFLFWEPPIIFASTRDRSKLSIRSWIHKRAIPPHHNDQLPHRFMRKDLEAILEELKYSVVFKQGKPGLFDFGERDPREHILSIEHLLTAYNNKFKVRF